MCNLPAWLRAACLVSLTTLVACNSDEVDFGSEPSMTLSGRVTDDQPMTRAVVVGTWSAFSSEHGEMGVSLSSSGELKYRLPATDDDGVPMPAGFAKWQVINNILIIKWLKQSGQDECVSRVSDAEMTLSCTTISGPDDGISVDYYLNSVSLATELPGTIWGSGNVTVHFTSNSRYILKIEDQEWARSWSSTGLRLTLNDFAVCDFAGGVIESGALLLVCRGLGDNDEYLTRWVRHYEESEFAADEGESSVPDFSESDQATPPPPLLSSY